MFGLWPISCQREDRFEPEEEGTAITNFVSQAEALEVAEGFDFSKKQFNSSSGESKGFKEVVNILDVPANSMETSYYIVNYENGGFAIISADNRLIPVLAFSETNSFPTDAEHYPGGLVEWLYKINEVVKETRTANVEQTPEIKALWDKIVDGGDIDKNNNSKRTTFDPSDCPYEGYTFYTSQQYGPLCSTLWGQWEPYNNYVPLTGCSSSNGRAPTGCVPTAMAQVMRYNAFPNDYNWGSMPNNYANGEVMQLMVDCGDAVDIDYDCEDGSSASTSDVPSALINYFNYTSASYANYSYTTVKNEIQNNHPVILRGGRNVGWWIFGIYDDGHAWVADGSLEIFYYQCVYNPFYQEYELVNTVNYLYFNMNWGWTGSYNGWYAFNNFNPGSHTFNYQTKMVYNIRH
ncbi:MAG: C10 family peptidase [Sedimentibacter sp.]|uniref:C10 family peptidase n=1 Tax=Sedimentibacter sp. TaxID=1960295 RepID=UPI002980FCED|nr:C10 family peptidase [Sedimentibacter sp.]MDW5299090.1 C10 family peptidase [Sedimentibacter sp.]